MARTSRVQLLLAAVLVALVLPGLARAGEQTLAAASSWQVEVVDATDCWFPSLALDSAGQP